MFRPQLRLGIVLTGCQVLPVLLAMGRVQQLPNQAFEALPRVSHATVGDTVAVAFRVRLDPEDLLYDTVPRPLGELPEGIRVLRVAKLHRAPDRTFAGEADLAYFRTGHQPIPLFGLDFMRGVKGMTRATLASDSAFVDIDSVAPPGNPALKDIREMRARPFAASRALEAALALAGSAVLVLLHRRRKPPSEAAPVTRAVEHGVAPSAHERAMLRLEEIEKAEWLRQGEVGRHYAAVADTVRQYLEEAHGIPALTSTTSELGDLLPGKAVARRARCLSLLREADLAKFARLRPSAESATRYTAEARALVAEWGPDAPGSAAS